MPDTPPPRQRGRIAVVLLAFTCLAGAGLFHTWLRIQGLNMGYRLSAVTHAHKKLLRENEELRLEVATLKAPSRIEHLARTRLHMVTPRQGQVVVVREPPLQRAPTATARARPAKDGRGVLASIVEDLHGH